MKPSALQLIGRARYLMRIAQIGENATNHREADKIVSKVFGTVSKANSQASILHVKTLYQPRDPHHGSPYYIDLDQAEEILRHARQPRANHMQVYEAWAKLGYRELRTHLGAPHPHTTSTAQESRLESLLKDLEDTLDPSHNPEPALLMSIPRVYMALSIIKDPLELARRQPIRPGYYKLTLEVRLRGRIEDPRLAALGLASLILTPQLLGLGKAVNRGLGRFRLTGHTLGPATDKLGDYRDTVERILKALQQGLRGRECLREALRSYLTLLPPHNGERPRDEDLMAPSLPRATIMHTSSPLHPCPYAPAELPQADEDGYCRNHHYDCSQIQDGKIRAYCILSAIGAATLKSVWKLRRGDELEAPGPGYHTWILGLPRNAKRIDRNRKIRNTGYYVVKKGPGWNLPLESIKDPKSNLIEKAFRHQSIFILFPQTNGSLYLVAMPSYGSLARILEDDPMRPGKALYHAGLHWDSISHWLKVTYIATQVGRSDIINELHGVITPITQHILTHHGDIRYNIVYDAYNAALDWLRVLLGLNHQYSILD